MPLSLAHIASTHRASVPHIQPGCLVAHIADWCLCPSLQIPRVPVDWIVLKKESEEDSDFWCSFRGPESDIPASPLLRECVIEVGNIRASWVGPVCKWAIDVRVYDHFSHGGGTNSPFQEADIGPMTLEELPTILLRCPSDLTRRVGEGRCEEELLRRQRCSEAQIIRLRRDYESRRERNLIENERMMMQLGVRNYLGNAGGAPDNSGSECSHSDSEEVDSDDSEALSTQSTEDPLAVLARQGRLRRGLAAELLNLRDGKEEANVLERGLYVSGYDSDSNDDSDDGGGRPGGCGGCVGYRRSTRGTKRRRTTVAASEAVASSVASEVCQAENLDRGRSAFADSSSRLPSTHPAEEEEEEEDYALEYPTPSSFVDGALSDSSSNDEQDEHRGEDSEEEEEEERWAADLLRQHRSALGDAVLVDETELDSIRIQGASVSSLGQVGIMFCMAANRGSDLLSLKDDKKSLGGDFVQLTSFPAAVYVQVPPDLSREEFMHRLTAMLSMSHKFVYPPSRYFYASSGNDKRVCHTTKVPRNVSCSVLMRALEALGVKTCGIAMHGTSFKVKDLALFPFLQTDFTAGLNPDEKSRFRVTIDLSITHRIPGFWAVRGPDEGGGCRTYLEGGDVSNAFGSVKLRALVQDGDGKKVLHFDIPRGKQREYPTLHAMKRVVGVESMTFYSPFQHQRSGVVSKGTEWNSFGSNISGCRNRVATMMEAITRIEECDARRGQLPPGVDSGTVPPLKYSDGMRSEVCMVFHDKLTIESVRERARVAVEMRFYTMCELLGWQRRCLKRTLQRGRSMCHALEQILSGQANSASTVEQRHGIAVLYSVLGHSGGCVVGHAFRKRSQRQSLLGAGVQEDGCIALTAWHGVGWYMRQARISKEVLQRTRDQTLCDIRAHCFFGDRRAIGRELDGGKISFKMKGRDEWNDKGNVTFATVSAAADEIYRRFKKRWRQHVSLDPSTRRWQAARDRAERKMEAELSRPYPCRPANAKGLRGLHQLRLHGDAWLEKGRVGPR